MSKSSSSRSASGFVQPGAIVTARYGPLEEATASAYAVAIDSLSPPATRRKRSLVRGVVLQSHSKNQWLVHWFSIGRCSHAPFCKLKVCAGHNPISASHVADLLMDAKDNYIGGPDKVRTYFDNYTKQTKRPAVAEIPSPEPKRQKTSDKPDEPGEPQCKRSTTATVTPSPAAKHQKTTAPPSTETATASNTTGAEGESNIRDICLLTNLVKFLIILFDTPSTPAHPLHRIF